MESTRDIERDMPECERGEELKGNVDEKKYIVKEMMGEDYSKHFDEATDEQHEKFLTDSKTGL